MVTHGSAIVIFFLVVVDIQCFLAKKNLNLFPPFVVMVVFLKKSKFGYNLPKKNTTLYIHMKKLSTMQRQSKDSSNNYKV